MIMELGVSKHGERFFTSRVYTIYLYSTYIVLYMYTEYIYIHSNTAYIYLHRWWLVGGWMNFANRKTQDHLLQSKINFIPWTEITKFVWQNGFFINGHNNNVQGETRQLKPLCGHWEIWFNVDIWQVDVSQNGQYLKPHESCRPFYGELFAFLCLYIILWPFLAIFVCILMPCRLKAAEQWVVQKLSLCRLVHDLFPVRPIFARWTAF